MRYCGAEQQQRRVLEEEGDAERRDQRRDPRGVAQRPVGEALDREPEKARAEHRDHEHAEDEQRDRDRRVERAAQERQDAEADERADHVDVAVREVEQLEDPVDHRVAQRDQRVDAPEDDPVHRQLEVERPAGASARSRPRRPSRRRAAARGPRDWSAAGGLPSSRGAYFLRRDVRPIRGWAARRRSIQLVLPSRFA